MAMRMRVLLMAAVACACSLGVVSPAAAGNHLRCYKTRDTIARQRFSGVTLNSNTGLPSATGCQVSTGARLCCDPVDKVGVPPQQGGNNTVFPDTTKFCCYKLKCPQSVDLTFQVSDQFGTRNVVSRKSSSRLLCAPASPSSAFLDDASLF